MMLEYTATDNKLIGLDILKGDKLIFDMEAQPQPGDITLIEYKGEYQPVWYIGHDFMEHPIIVSKYDKYPQAISLHVKVTLVGVLYRHNRSGQLLSSDASVPLLISI